MTDKFKPGDLCEYDGTPLPVTEDGRGDACPVCEQDLTGVDTSSTVLDTTSSSEVQHE